METDFVRRFEENRPRLLAVAHRMLGSRAEAEDAVQETWLRLSRTDAGAVDNLDAWLTTVAGRVCLDMLRSRARRGETEWDAALPDDGDHDPENEAVIADSVGLALLVVLETLSPAERLAFVLHDLFGMPFDEIAPIVGKESAAARQLASRARRRVRVSDIPVAQGPDRPVVDAFLEAARGGSFETLLTVLDPDVVLRFNGVESHWGSEKLARFFSGKAQAARVALVDGELGIAVVLDGRTVVAARMEFDSGRITLVEGWNRDIEADVILL